MQHQQTRLRRNRHPDFVCDFLPSAAFEIFFCEQNLDVIEKFGLVGGWQSNKKRNVVLDGLEPFIWKRPRFQPFPMSIFQEADHVQSCRGACPRAQRFSTAAEDRRPYNNSVLAFLRNRDKNPPLEVSYEHALNLSS